MKKLKLKQEVLQEPLTSSNERISFLKGDFKGYHDSLKKVGQERNFLKKDN